MHSTDDLEDGYFGSGKRLKYSISKYGKENHVFEILEYFETRKKLSDREEELVNEDLLANPFCINLKFGGEGVNSGYLTEETKRKISDAKTGVKMEKYVLSEENQAKRNKNFKSYSPETKKA